MLESAGLTIFIHCLTPFFYFCFSFRNFRIYQSVSFSLLYVLCINIIIPPSHSHNIIRPTEHNFPTLKGILLFMLNGKLLKSLTPALTLHNSYAKRR
jgi:hypothetical protein